jgi:ribosomal protein S12 methylthiotransferase accessory factor
MSGMRTSFRRLADIVDRLLDHHVGVVRFVKALHRNAGDPEFFYCYAQACSTQAFSRQSNFGRTGGASVDPERALAKSIGEAVERYCSALYDVEALPLCSYEVAPFPCVKPGDFALPNREQYARRGFLYVPFGPKTPIRWTPALDPLTGETRHVPAAMVFMPYLYYTDSGDSPIIQPISTGLACHCSPTEAAVNAVCEVIERDAFMLTWQARMAHPHIRHDTLSAANRDLVRRFEKAGYSITLLDITLDVGVPTILAVSHSDALAAPALAVAASAELDPEQAVRKSLEELAHTLSYCKKIKERWPSLAPDPTYLNVADQKDHLRFWCDQSNAHLADFLSSSQDRIAFSDIANGATGDPERDLKVLLQRVESVKHRVYLCDLTTPDVEELGLSVVRAVIPGFHPLVVGHGNRALGSARLWSVPQKLGFPRLNPLSGDNPLPHPYP